MLQQAVCHTCLAQESHVYKVDIPLKLAHIRVREAVW